jgi:hypothetical protein
MTLGQGVRICCKCIPFAFALTKPVISLWIHCQFLFANKNGEVGMLEDTRSAILRAYGEMKARGVSEARAFETATRVFHHRLPEVPSEDAKFVVADWISQSLGQ